MENAAPDVTTTERKSRAHFLHLERGGDPFENRLNAERELVTT